MRIAVIGGGAAGLGAAGAAKAVDPNAEVVVYTADTDVAYSPCGIPYVHGREIDSFERLFLATKEQYVNTGIDVHYETTVEAIDAKARTLTVAGEGVVSYDRLIIGAGWNYAKVDVDGADLDGIYEVKYIRAAMDWDKRLDSCKSAVIVEAGLVAMEMVAALLHRGIKVTVVDRAPWPMADVLDPDIVEPVRQAWEDADVDMQWGNWVTAFKGDGAVSRVETEQGAIDTDIVIIGTHKVPNNPLAEAAGLQLGTTGGLVVDSRMQTSDPNIYAAGDCTEIPHGVTDIPIQGLTGSHAYAQGKTAGTNAAGGTRHYRPVFVPWGLLAGEWMIGGVSFGETLATALGIQHVVGKAQGITRARYYPGVRPITVKLLAEPGSLRLIGAQMVGGEGIKERADFLAMAVRVGLTVEELATMENVYSPAIGALNEPISVAAQNLLAGL
ncbi:MAG: CoA-disulfide reductase [Acidimicrobiaceae bacterium]|nr:FAD-dependent oxidoreductase [Acidimicrobiaceae bacterium]MCY3642664.1 FAD-dependent oxidoreductase [Acidimicrobiaceae bacterium]MDE0664608.1 FAD-dependent oxidoreductase [Acidimicrobiaceae bacterium]MXW89474.1 CoA-disulfide reductase [Acidimicrobiaceae bacterium]MXZ66475.1 CoA-disulfide reductase [Acidimicrobiaceae bacterium]